MAYVTQIFNAALSMAESLSQANLIHLITWISYLREFLIMFFNLYLRLSNDTFSLGSLLFFKL